MVTVCALKRLCNALLPRQPFCPSVVQVMELVFNCSWSEGIEFVVEAFSYCFNIITISQMTVRIAIIFHMMQTINFMRKFSNITLPRRKDEKGRILLVFVQFKFSSTQLIVRLPVHSAQIKEYYSNPQLSTHSSHK